MHPQPTIDVSRHREAVAAVGLPIVLNGTPQIRPDGAPGFTLSKSQRRGEAARITIGKVESDENALLPLDALDEQVPDYVVCAASGGWIACADVVATERADPDAVLATLWYVVGTPIDGHIPVEERHHWSIA
jgi:hypothetical protein